MILDTPIKNDYYLIYYNHDQSMMFILFFFVALNAVPFNLNASTTGYIIKGTYCQNFGICSNATMVIDPQNNRMLFDVGDNGGKYIVNEDSAYVLNQPLDPETCFKVNGWNYASQVAGYTTLSSTPGSTTLISRYYGFASDIASCDHHQSITAIQSGKIILELDVSQMVPVTIPEIGSVCFNSISVLKFDIDTFDIHSNRNPYFVLPSICDTPTDYCNFIYPPGNPCAIPQ
jgi:hypothetical protein